MTVRIQAKLPKGDTNGLAHLEGKIAEDPDAVYVVVGLLQQGTVVSRPHERDDKRVVNTVLLHVEALDGKSADATEKLLRRMYAERTGKRELPFEEGSSTVVEGDFPQAAAEDGPGT